VSRERELAKIEEEAGYITSFAWPGKQMTFRENVCNAIEAACRLGERLGREDSDNVYWPALCEQWRIEFGKELGQEGGHIMCVVDGVKELIRQEREQCLSLAVCALDADTVAEAIRARGVAQLEKNAKI